MGMIKVEQVIDTVDQRVRDLRATQPAPWAHLQECTDEGVLNQWLVRCRMNNFLPSPS